MATSGPVAPAPRTGTVGHQGVGRARPRAGQVLLSVMVGGAGAVHLALTPEHFEESVLFGAFFLAAAAFQLWLAAALVLRPGPAVWRAGLWGSAGLVATWMVTRLIPPPTASAPEPVEFWGVLATGLEIAAVVGLAATLPSVGPLPGPARRRLLAAASGTGFGLLLLLASGVVTVLPQPWDGPPYVFRLYDVGLARVDGLFVVVAGKWTALVPWLVAGFVLSSTLLVAWTVSLSLRLPQAERFRARRRGVLAAVPAGAAVPLCCGTPLAAFAGGAAVGTLFLWAPWVMGATVLLLATNVLLLRRRLRPRAGHRPAQVSAARDDAERGRADGQGRRATASPSAR